MFAPRQETPSSGIRFAIGLCLGLALLAPAALARDALGFRADMTYSLLKTEASRRWEWNDGGAFLTRPYRGD